MDSAKYVIIGAGLAGAATAYFLARQGEREVLILEREQVPGLHSSGRNAAMVRQVVAQKDILRLAARGARFFHSRPEDWDQEVPLARTGSILVAGQWSWLELEAQSRMAGEHEVECEIWQPDRIKETVPCTERGRFCCGVYCPLDGVTDTDRLMSGFLGAARRYGVRLESEREVTGILTERGKVAGVETTRGPVRCETVVNAAGAWAAGIAARAGALEIELTPLRRHLMYTGELDWVDPSWPYIWDIERDVYFRPESGGLLLSPCDEARVEPGIPVTDPAAQDLLAEKLGHSFPQLLELPIARSWAGIRTFAPDRMFVLGWDPRLTGFYWVAGLGGHGVTTSPAVGELAAGELLAGRTPEDSPFRPARFPR